VPQKTDATATNGGRSTSVDSQQNLSTDEERGSQNKRMLDGGPAGEAECVKMANIE
jgi:hypothetical protein